MKKLTAALMLIATMSLAGCAPTKYYKEGAGQPDFDIDYATCQRDAPQADNQQSAPGDKAGAIAAFIGNVGNIAAQNAYVDNCMIAAGWSKKAPLNPKVKEFNDALMKAAAKCTATDADDKYKAVAYHKCIYRVQRPVWKKYAPSLIGDYDDFMDETADLAKQFHDGDISHAEYAAAIKKSRADFTAAIKERDEGK